MGFCLGAWPLCKSVQFKSQLPAAVLQQMLPACLQGLPYFSGVHFLGRGEILKERKIKGTPMVTLSPLTAILQNMFTESLRQARKEQWPHSAP